jgi:hemerythrin
MHAKLSQIISDIDVQHQHLLQLVNDLEVCDHVHMVPLLEELTTLVDDHFLRETRPGGLYEAVGAKTGEKQSEVERLEQEHILISSACRGILARAHLGAEDSEPVLLKELKDVMRCLSDHEKREGIMVNRLLNA